MAGERVEVYHQEERVPPAARAPPPGPPPAVSPRPTRHLGPGLTSPPTPTPRPGPRLRRRTTVRGWGGWCTGRRETRICPSQTDATPGGRNWCGAGRDLRGGERGSRQPCAAALGLRAHQGAPGSRRIGGWDGTTLKDTGRASGDGVGHGGAPWRGPDPFRGGTKALLKGSRRARSQGRRPSKQSLFPDFRVTRPHPRGLWQRSGESRRRPRRRPRSLA